MPSPLHILAVDDHAEVTAFLKEFLEQGGHRVDCAGNGIEALNAINAMRRNNDRYQLVLTDVHMPLLDGLSLIKELRRAKEYVDVAIITGNFAMMPHLEADAQKLGCLMVLHKPLATDQLIQLVEFVGMRAARAPTPNPTPSGMTSRVANPDTPFGAANAANQAASQRRVAGGPPSTDEYLPTPSSRGQVAPPAAADLNARRTGQFYPAAPPAQPQAGQPPFPQRRADDPRYSSRESPPQAMPAAVPPAEQWDPRQGQGLPPVPAPVAQPTYSQQPMARDPRYTTGVRDPRLAPGFAAPLQPADPRFAPQAPGYQAPPYQLPQQAADPRYPAPAPAYQPQQPQAYQPQAYQQPPAYPQPPVYQQPPAYQAPPVYQQPQPDPRRTSRVALPPAQQLPAQAPYDQRLAPPPPGFQTRPIDPRRTSAIALPPVPPATGMAAPPRARPLDAPPAMRTPLPSGNTNADPYAPQTDPQFRNAPMNDPANQSNRVRRSVVGTTSTPLPIQPETNGGNGVRMVACAYCRGSFRAGIKPTPYNLVCVHCGQLNRIDP